ncbi:MAG: Flp family type IVb pilin [Rhodospirillales bacterium]|nr:Flp family type IVb pilin [Rhodospirillales bacterium]
MKLNSVTNILRDESGATAIEYGLIAGLVSVVAITALSATGDSLISIFEKVSGKLAEAAQ